MLGHVYNPSWPPYWKLLFLETTLVETIPENGRSRKRRNSDDDLSLASVVRNMQSENSDSDLSLVTMVKNPRISSSFPTEDDSSSNLPDIRTTVTSTPDSSNGRGSSPQTVNTNHPLERNELERLKPSLHVSYAELPTRIDDEIQKEAEGKTYEEVSSQPPGHSSLDPTKYYSSGPQSPILSRPIFPLTDLSAPPLASTSPLRNTSSPISVPNSLPLSLRTDISNTPISQKRGYPDSDSVRETAFNVTTDSLRTLPSRIREDTDDDVSGFLKMIGFQLRNINEPLRRMRVMHGIQGIILDETASQTDNR